jgi:hypothetical protein
MCSYLPVENGLVRQVDTIKNYQISAEWQNATEEIEQMCNGVKQGINRSTFRTKGKRKKDSLVGFVPIQIVNPSLEEVELRKHTYVGMATPAQCYEIDNTDDYDVSVI